MNPLKQGLKLHCTSILGKSSLVKVVNPLKQGLKLDGRYHLRQKSNAS